MAINMATMRAVRIDVDGSADEIDVTVEELGGIVGGSPVRIALTTDLDMWVDGGQFACNRKAALLAVHCGVPFRRYGGAVVVTGNVDGRTVGLSAEKAHALCGLANLLGDVIALTCEPSAPWRTRLSQELQCV